ncbi:MAG: hypothetical protein ABIJ86_02175 [Spirochaetota bacterium]
MNKVRPLVMIILLTLAACGNRTTSMPGKDSIVGMEATTPTPPTGQEGAQSGLAQQPGISMSTTNATAEKPEAQSAPPTGAAKAPAGAAKAPVAAAKASAAKVVVIQPSRSLAGHDRFLVSRPFGEVQPADFELGPLMDRTIDPSITPLLDGLAKAMLDKKLEAATFSSQGLMLAQLLYAADLASAAVITKVRFSEARHMPGTAYAVAMRLFSELGFADGLAILGTDDEGNWLIEQLDLELDGLGEPATRSELWDPYGYSRNLLD